MGLGLGLGLGFGLGSGLVATRAFADARHVELQLLDELRRVGGLLRLAWFGFGFGFGFGLGLGSGLRLE